VPVPGRRCPPTPRGRDRDRDRLRGERRHRPVAAELTQQPREGLVIGATRRSGQGRLGEKRRGGRSEGLLGGCQGDNPPDHAWSSFKDVAGNASASQATASAGHQGHSQWLVIVVAGNGRFPAKGRLGLSCPRAVATPGTAPTDALVLAACDLMTWTQALLLDGELAVAEPKTLRYRLCHMAARVPGHACRIIVGCNAPGHGRSICCVRSPGCAGCRCAAEPRPLRCTTARHRARPACPPARQPRQGVAVTPTRPTRLSPSVMHQHLSEPRRPQRTSAGTHMQEAG
jgi:hypothetical protein